MAYEIEEIRLSQQIFYYLLEHFELKEEDAAVHRPEYLRLSQAERERQEKERDFRI